MDRGWVSLQLESFLICHHSCRGFALQSRTLDDGKRKHEECRYTLWLRGLTIPVNMTGCVLIGEKREFPFKDVSVGAGVFRSETHDFTSFVDG